MICKECEGQGFHWFEAGLLKNPVKEVCKACEGLGVYPCPECDDKDPKCKHCEGFRELD